MCDMRESEQNLHRWGAVWRGRPGREHDLLRELLLWLCELCELLLCELLLRELPLLLEPLRHEPLRHGGKLAREVTASRCRLQTQSLTAT
jgi:hypothetical protein